MKNLLMVGLIGFLSTNAFATQAKHTGPQTECAKEEHYPMVTKAELEKMVQEKSAFVIDVNSDESFKEEHVPGAIHYKTSEAKFATLLPKDKAATIVAYCGGPACTAWKKAAEKACMLGYTNIKHFKEGISGWKKKS